jgi:outer membrane immunogenic protein
MTIRISRTASLLAATSALMLGAGAAHAQSTDWSGPYVGVTAGYSQGDYDLRSAPLLTSPGSPLFGSYGGTTANSQPNFEVKGEEYGLTGGFNLQSGNWVYGVEGDASLSQANDAVWIADRPAPGTNRFTTRLEGDVDYSATLRARLGYSLGPVLLYGTGGGAMMRASLDRSYLNASGAEIGDKDGETYFGLAYGGGAEWAVNDRWSIKGEYLRTDFQRETHSHAYGPDGIAFSRVDQERDIGRVGMNYRF